MEKERLINPAAGIGDDRVDQALRPKRLAEVTGQDQVRENLAILLSAAQKRALENDPAADTDAAGRRAPEEGNAGKAPPEGETKPARAKKA